MGWTDAYKNAAAHKNHGSACQKYLDNCRTLEDFQKAKPACQMWDGTCRNQDGRHHALNGD